MHSRSLVKLYGMIRIEDIMQSLWAYVIKERVELLIGEPKRHFLHDGDLYLSFGRSTSLQHLSV